MTKQERFREWKGIRYSMNRVKKIEVNKAEYKVVIYHKDFEDLMEYASKVWNPAENDWSDDHGAKFFEDDKIIIAMSRDMIQIVEKKKN